MQNKFKCPPLFFAAIKGYRNIASALIEKGAKVNLAEEDGFTSLHYAAYYRHLAIVDLLIEKGAEINSPDINKATPLYLAAEKGHIAIVDLLIEKGAKVYLADKDGWTPLHIAAQNGHLAVVDLLIGKGANINLANQHSWTPLHIAAEKGHLDIVELLMKKGAIIDFPSNDKATPLFIAADNGHAKIVEALFKAGAEINTLGFNNWHPLSMAIGKSHNEVAKLLIKLGANINIIHPEIKCTPLMIATGIGKIMFELENESLKEANKPELPIPSEQAYKECAKTLLLTHKVDLSLKDSNGNNAYDLAKKVGYAGMMQLLNFYESFQSLVQGELKPQIIKQMQSSTELQEFFKDLSLSYFYFSKIKLATDTIDNYINIMKIGEGAFSDDKQKEQYNKILNQVKAKLAADEIEMVAHITAIETTIIETYAHDFAEIILLNTIDKNPLFSSWQAKKVDKSFIGKENWLSLIGRKYKEGSSEDYEGEIYGQGIILERFLNNISLVEPMEGDMLVYFSDLFSKVKYNLNDELQAKGEEFIQSSRDQKDEEVISFANDHFEELILDDLKQVEKLGVVCVDDSYPS